MKIDKYNHEGYYDPTVYEALTNIERERLAAQTATKPHPSPRQSTGQDYRPIVFICSPYADDPINNERRATRYCRFAVQQGYLPIAPHIYFTRFLDDRKQEDRDAGLFMGQVLLRKCSELWYFGDRITNGMEREIELAKERRMLIRHFDEDMKEVKRNG